MKPPVTTACCVSALITVMSTTPESAADGVSTVSERPPGATTTPEPGLAPKRTTAPARSAVPAIVTVCPPVVRPTLGVMVLRVGGAR